MKTAAIYIVFITILFTSCGVNRVYTPGSYGSGTIKSYNARPIYKDTTVSETYISGSISKGAIKHLKKESSKDQKILTTLNIHKGISTKKFNFHYGLGASYGKYTFKYPLGTLIRKNETKNFYSFNAKIGGNLRKSKENSEKRRLGLELNYTYEFGPYQNKLTFLKEQLDSKKYIIVNKKSMISLNMYWERIFIINPSNNFGYQLYLGWIVGDIKEKYNIPEGNSQFGGLILYYTHKKYTFSFVNEISSHDDSRSLTFGISYKL